MVLTGAGVKMRPATLSGVLVVSSALSAPSADARSTNCVMVLLKVAFILTFPSAPIHIST